MSILKITHAIFFRSSLDIGSIMRLEEIHPKIKYSVSWTNKSVSYFLHEIDRRKLEEFFRNCKAPRNKVSFWTFPCFYLKLSLNYKNFAIYLFAY